MNDLKHYILHLKKWMPENIVNKTVEELALAKWKRHEYRYVETGTHGSKNGDKELDVTYEYPTLTYDKELHDLVWKGLYRYFVEEPKGPSISGWQGFTKIRFNRYRVGQIMSKHCDHIHDVFDGQRKGIPTVSILGGLNDNYEGGQFIMFDDYEIKIEAGDLLLFPSVFLYPHKVEPVTKGERYSFVSWAW